MATTPAIAIASFATATALEVVGYYVPRLDHALGAVATPRCGGRGRS